MNENGEPEADKGVTVPAPFSDRVTLVAFPPKVFPATVMGVVPQVDPAVLLNDKAGPFTQPQSMVKILPVVVQPEEFLTVML